MLASVDFSNFDPGKSGSGNGSKIPFLRFEEGKTYRIRPLAEAVMFYKIFIEKGKPSLVIAAADKDSASKIVAEYTGKEVKASPRYAMFVIDRADAQVKILEGGYQIFEAFALWTKGTQIQPGSGQAGDWMINVEGNGVSGSNPRRYTTGFLATKPFSEDEKTTLKKMKADGLLKLGNFFKETPVDQIIAKLSGKTEGESETSAGIDDADLKW